MDIAPYIADLLTQQNEVYLNGFGTFFKQRIAGFFDESAGVFVPPSHQIAFKLGGQNSSLLTSFICSKRNISETSAEYFIDQYALSLENEIQNGEVTLEGLGTLHKENDEYYLKTNDFQNISDFSFFGLKPIAEIEVLPTQSTPVQSDISSSEINTAEVHTPNEGITDKDDDTQQHTTDENYAEDQKDVDSDLSTSEQSEQEVSPEEEIAEVDIETDNIANEKQTRSQEIVEPEVSQIETPEQEFPSDSAAEGDEVVEVNLQNPNISNEEQSDKQTIVEHEVLPIETVENISEDTLTTGNTNSVEPNKYESTRNPSEPVVEIKDLVYQLGGKPNTSVAEHDTIDGQEYDNDEESSSWGWWKKLVLSLLILLIIVVGTYLIYPQAFDGLKKIIDAQKPAVPVVVAPTVMDSLQSADDSLRKADEVYDKLKEVGLEPEKARDTVIQTVTDKKLDKPKITYEIIVVSFETMAGAEKYVAQMKRKGFDAHIVNQAPGNRIKVSLASFTSQDSAQKELPRFMKDINKEAWIFKNKPNN